MIKKILFILIALATVSSYSQSPTIIVEASQTGEEEVDGYENGIGDISLSSSDLEFFYEQSTATDNEQIIAVRFAGINIPKDATISNAYIQFTADQPDSGSVIVRIEGDDVDNSQELDTNNDFDFSGRTPTTASVTWDIDSWTTGSNGTNERTDDLSTIVSEITSRTGWTAGNAITFIFTGISSTNTNTIREAESGDVDGTSPVLHIEYAIDAPTETSESIPENATWRYFDGGAAPANDGEGDTWIEQGFNDSSWSYGLAELGYGDGDEATVVDYGSDPDNKYITTYFRKEFTITDKSIYNSIDLRAIRDDGLVVYLNGSEVWRDNIAGTVSYSTLANSPEISGSSESTWISESISSSLLVDGTNTIAVEIHQQRVNSSDISFNFELTPSATVVNDEIISEGDTWKYLDDGSDQDATNWKLNSYDDSSWFSGITEIGYSNSNSDGAATDIGQPSEPRPITTYFRKDFTITSDQASKPSIMLEAVRDDAIAVYIDGTLVWKDGLDNGFNSSTEANQTIGGDEEEAWISEIISNNLAAGDHTVAVEIHQTSDSSSDISFNFRLTIGDFPITVERGPYLQTGTDTSVIVKWRTNIASNSIVNYGTLLGSLSSSESDANLTTEHEVELTGLLKNTIYYYDIANSDGVYLSNSSNMYVKTAPEVGTKQFVRAWVLGDAGVASEDPPGTNQQNVRDAYYGYVNGTNVSPAENASSNIGQTDMMLFLGDNAYTEGTDAQFQIGMFDIYDEMLKKSVAWSCVGNHEARNTSNSNTQTGAYYDIFTFPKAGESGGNASGTEAYYSFDYANIHFIVLESYEIDRSVGGAMYNWMVGDISSTTQDWIVAFWHHPPYTKGSHDSDDAGESGGMMDFRKDFLPKLEEYGVDLVLSGHSHSYERSFFINGHYGDSDSFDESVYHSSSNPDGHLIGGNGGGDGKVGSDEPYKRTETGITDEEVKGAVYVVTGSAGKISGFQSDAPHESMYDSRNKLGSSIIEIDSDGSGGQKLTLKFLTDAGAIEDNFTIHKPSTQLTTLSTETFEVDNNLIKLYPVPSNSFINVAIKTEETLDKVEFYNMVGALVKVSKEEQINVRDLQTGIYMVQIITDKNRYYKSIIIE